MKQRNDTAIEFEADERQAIFLGLATSIVRDIERGRLKPGAALPGTRTLAKSLKLHRNTVDAAYHELTMQGWLTAEPSRGTFVAGDLPAIRSRPAKPIAHAPETGKTSLPALLVSDGAPDPRIMPRVELARAFRRAMVSPAFLSGASYGDPRGVRALRVALAEYLGSDRGLTASPDEILVTRGSQMGLFLAAAAVITPGQAIAVEVPGYPLAWAAFRAAGAKIIAVPVDAQGVDVTQLENIAKQQPALKAIYVTPHHQYPTTVTLGAGRRLKLLDIARKHGLVVIEDDYDHEYRFDGRPVLPLAVRTHPEQPIVYVGSLSKLLAPAIRVGYVTGRPDILARMADQREAIDRQGDFPLEQALAALIEDGVLHRQTRKARRIYAARRDLLAEELSRHLGNDVMFDLPAGGMALWLRLRNGLSAETWAASAARAGLAITPGIRFAIDAAHAPEAFRFGYADLGESEIRQAVQMLARTRPEQ